MCMLCLGIWVWVTIGVCVLLCVFIHALVPKRDDSIPSLLISNIIKQTNLEERLHRTLLCLCSSNSLHALSISYQFDPDCVWGFGQRLSHASFNPSIRSINCVQLIDQLSSLWKCFSIWISIETLALIHAFRPDFIEGLYLLDFNQHCASAHFWWFLVTVRIST